MSKNSVKVNLSDKASQELEDIATALDIPKAEVLRKGLAIMRLYADVQNSKNSALLFEKDGEQRRLMLID